MVSAIQEFVGSNEEIKQILADFGSSSIYKTVVSYAKSWGMQIPPWDADRAKEQVYLELVHIELLYHLDQYLLGDCFGCLGRPACLNVSQRVVVASQVDDKHIVGGSGTY